MKVSRRFLVLGSAWLQLAGTAVRAQGEGELREFTDKRGQKVSAKLVGISEDRRVMSILREDGKSFETVINQLSLDDQQYVKDWLKSRVVPGASATTVSTSSSLRVDVVVTRTSGETRKHRSDDYAMEEKDNLYRITVKNLSRETISSARVEYAVVWRNAVTIYEDKDDAEWEFTTHAEDGVSPQVKILGDAVVENLRFNDEFAFETKPVSIDQVFLDGNAPYREDELLGLRARVVSADGAVVLDTHSGSAEVASMTWEEVVALGDPRVID
jgi:hypothetical protein